MFTEILNKALLIKFTVAIIIIGWGGTAVSQTLVTSPMTGTPAAGTYYSNTGITVSPGFSFTASSGQSLVLYAGTPDCLPLNNNLSGNQNYILVAEPRVSGYSPQLAGYTSCDLKQTVQYFDGLGRPIQTVQVQGSPQNKDMVQPIAYDQFGRESAKFLDYAASTSDGSYKIDALSAGVGLYAFYNPGGNGSSGAQQSGGVVVNPSPYSPVGFESSPLNRVIEQGAPGTPWQLSTSGITGSGHTIKIAYGTNAATDVIQWTVNSTGTGATETNNYDAGKLYVKTTTDENGNNTIEYTDKLGHVVCKKMQSGANTYLSTYYVYNDLNNLTYVIPPIPSTTTYPTSFLESDLLFSNFIYGYHYDGRNRLVEKQVPGKGWEYILYNTIDQAIATQDAVQRSKSPEEWTFTKYDAQGRMIISGVYQYGSTAGTNYRAALQAIAAGTTLWETAISTGTGYTTTAWPTSWTGATLSMNYYDSYSTIPGLPASFTAPSGSSQMTTGLLLASQVNVLGTSNMLWTANYYDDLGRVIQTYKQHYLGGTASVYNYDQVTNTYDFTNELLGSTRKHYIKNAGNTAAVLNVTIANSFVYDHMGRKTQTLENINNSPVMTLLSQTDYNEIGQAKTKHLHSTNNGQSFLQDISYVYNERGWLQKINDPSVAVSSNKLFSEQLNYNLPQYGGTAQYNGNIAEQDYNAGISTRQHVVYSYDQLSRLNSGTSSAGFSETGLTYDNMGNLLTLTRAGTGNGTLTYGYTGNQLTTLTGFKSGTNVYDLNGNLKTDGTRGATIQYNMLNLPQSVTATGISISYTYDASGTKLRKVSNGSSTDYISGIQYKPDAATIDFIQTEEGRAINAGTGYNYEYTLTDHLGNNRVAFDQANGKVTEDDYYPFGYNVHRQQNSVNNYLYNKKELQTEINEYDYGARFYDPVIGRWNVVDPLAEKSRRFSPYNYVENNPIRLIDPDGMEVKDGNCCGVHGNNNSTNSGIGNPLVRAALAPKAVAHTEAAVNAAKHTASVSLSVGTGVGFSVSKGDAKLEAKIGGPTGTLKLSGDGATLNASVASANAGAEYGNLKADIGKVDFGGYTLQNIGTQNMTMTGNLPTAEGPSMPSTSVGKAELNSDGNMSIGGHIGVIGAKVEANLQNAVTYVKEQVAAAKAMVSSWFESTTNAQQTVPQNVMEQHLNNSH